jgi:hypothetical protein
VQGSRDEEQRGLGYDQHQVWMVTVVVTLPNTLPCVLREEVGVVGKGSSSRLRYDATKWGAFRPAFCLPEGPSDAFIAPFCCSTKCLVLCGKFINHWNFFHKST